MACVGVKVDASKLHGFSSAPTCGLQDGSFPSSKESSWLRNVPISLPRSSAPARTASWSAPAPRAAVVFSIVAALRAVTFSPSNGIEAARPRIAVAKSLKKFGLSRSRRLIRTADFGVIARTRNARAFRVHSSYFSAGCLENDACGRLRIGVTVGKRNSPRSVDRALVKRVLREAARIRAPEIEAMLINSNIGLDLSLRLKTPLSDVGSQKAHAQLRAAIREDALSLLNDLVRRCAKRWRSEA